MVMRPHVHHYLLLQHPLADSLLRQIPIIFHTLVVHLNLDLLTPHTILVSQLTSPPLQRVRLTLLEFGDTHR